MKVIAADYSSISYQDHCECAHQTVKWKSNSLSVCIKEQPSIALNVLLIATVKCSNFATSSRLKLPVIALNQSYPICLGFALLSLWYSWREQWISFFLDGNESTWGDMVTQINTSIESKECAFCVNLLWHVVTAAFSLKKSTFYYKFLNKRVDRHCFKSRKSKVNLNTMLRPV